MASGIRKVNMITQIVRLRRIVRRWRIRSHRTPPGSLAVYVGPRRDRFVIPTRFLNLPVFVELLRQAEEEFGFQSSGGLTLPCDSAFFRQILRLLEDDEDRFRGLSVDDFVAVASEAVDLAAYCKEASGITAAEEKRLTLTH